MRTIKKSMCVSGGFTLVEVLFAIMILGGCIVATLASIQASTSTTVAGTEMTQAVILAQGLREWTMNLPWNDPDDADAGEDEASPGPNGTSPLVWVDDLNDLVNSDGAGTTYTPPVAPLGDPTNGYNIESLDVLSNWSEVITLSWRDPKNITGAPVTAGSTDVVYVEVTIRKNGEEILTTGWIITRRDDE